VSIVLCAGAAAAFYRTGHPVQFWCSVVLLLVCASLWLAMRRRASYWGRRAVEEAVREDKEWDCAFDEVLEEWDRELEETLTETNKDEVESEREVLDLIRSSGELDEEEAALAERRTSGIDMVPDSWAAAHLVASVLGVGLLVWGIIVRFS
jgi:hypothetical protein